MSEGEASLEPRETGEEINERKPIDALVVFGAGIVTDQSLEQRQMGLGQDENGKSIMIGHPEKGWRLPMAARLRVMAAAELYGDGQVEDVIFTGGQVAKGGGIEASEADLMEPYFLHCLKDKCERELKAERFGPKSERQNISEEEKTVIEKQVQEEIDKRLAEAKTHCLREGKATNTIENFAHTVNFLDQEKAKYQQIALLSNDFHIDRIMQLAQTMHVDGEGQKGDQIVNQIDPRFQKITDRYFNNAEANNAFREKVLMENAELSDDDPDKLPEEVLKARLGLSVNDIQAGERRWSRGLEELPEYYLPNIRFIQDPKRLKDILKAKESVQAVLKEKGVEDIDAASYDQLVNALSEVERKIPPEEWGTEN